MNNFNKLLKSELYLITGWDWTYSISGSLTEPLYTVIWVGPEGTNLNRYCKMVDRDKNVLTILDELCEKVHNEIILKIVQSKETSSLPFTNPDDEIFNLWLIDRCKGNDRELKL